MQNTKTIFNHVLLYFKYCANMKVLALIMFIEIRTGPLFCISVVSLKRQPAPMGSAAQCGDPKPAVEQWGPAGSPEHWQEEESQMVDKCGWLTLVHTCAHSLRRSHHPGTGRDGAQ